MVSIRIFSQFSVDASGSRDEDVASMVSTTSFSSSLSFRWKCVLMVPFIANKCVLKLTQISLATAVLTGTAGDISRNSTSSLTVTVFDATRESSMTQSIVVLAPTAPVVTVSSVVNTDVSINVNQQVALLGTVNLLGVLVGNATWHVSDSSLDLAALSLVSPFTVIVTGGTPSSSRAPLVTTVIANLVIPPNSLPARTSLIFTLSCTVSQVLLGPAFSMTATSSLVISTNGPPLPGVVGATPGRGVELTSAFTIAASSWSDTDLPIQYEFGFLSPSSLQFVCVQSKSPTSFGSTLLPAGRLIGNFSVVVMAHIFDSLGANESSGVTVVVVKSALSHNTGDLLDATRLQLNSAGSRVDSSKQVIATVAAVLNNVNCSHAPNCTSLHRLPCAASLNSCGSCLPGGVFVGDSGDSNEPCIKVSALIRTASLSLSSDSCSANSDCSESGSSTGWYECNRQTGMCVLRSKSCSGNCSNNGFCGFQSTLTGSSLDSCDIDSSQCSAVCLCNAGYVGASCEFTSAAFIVASDLRQSLLKALSNVMAMQNPDERVLSSWVGNLVELTKSEHELSDAAASSSLDLVTATLTSAASNLISFSSIELLPSVLDKIILAQLTNAASSSPSNAPPLSPSPVRSALDMLGSRVLADMIPGQFPQVSIHSTFRMTSLKLSPMPRSALPTTGSSVSTSVTMNFPLSSLESSQGALGSSIVLSRHWNSSTTSPLQVSMVSLHGAAIRDNVTSASSSNTSQVASTRVRVQLNPDAVCAQSTSAGASLLTEGPELTFVLPHSPEAVRDYGQSTGNATIHRILCLKGQVFNVTRGCPLGGNVSVHCDGHKSRVAFAQCPVLVHRPSCSVAAASGSNVKMFSCRTVASSSVATTCACRICTPLPATGHHSRLLQSSASSSDSDVMEIAAISDFALSDFVTAMETASSFNSVDALSKTITVIVTFVSLWIGMLLLVFTTEIWASWKKSQHKKVINKIKADSTSVGGGKSSEQSVALSVPKFGSVSPRPLPVNKMDDLNAVEENIKIYFSNFFPHVFSNQSQASRFWHVLFHKHKYFSVFFLDTGYQKWIGALELLTNLTANMFLLAVFYNLEWPSDDGTCDSLMTQASCNMKRSLIDSSKMWCAWEIAASSSDPSKGSCVWVKPSFDPNTLVMISLLVVLVSSPIYIVLSYIFNHVLLAPTVMDVRNKSVEALERRGTMKTMHNFVGFFGRISRFSGLLMRNKTGMSNTRVEKKVPETIPSVFSTTTQLDSTLLRHFVRARRAARILLKDPNLVKVAENTKGSDSTSVYDIIPIDSDATSFRDFSKLMEAMMSLDRSLSPAVQEKMRSMWHGSYIEGNEVNRVDVDTTSRDTLQLELDCVVREAGEWIDALKNEPDWHKGVKVLELFVLDLIGRNTKEAKIFVNQMNTVTSRVIITWGMKCMAFSLLLLMNSYFIFSCMLYGLDKGIPWQEGWLIASVVNLLLDIFIKQVNIAITINFFIPEVIAKTARSIQDITVKTMSKLVELKRSREKKRIRHSKHKRISTNHTHHNHAAKRPFSSSDYLFVSTHVARAFPTLLESAVVLSFWTSAVPVALRDRLVITSNGRAPDSELVVVSPMNLSVVGRVDRVFQDLKRCARYLVLLMGSQSSVAQKLVVGGLNPLLLALISFAGTSIFNDSLLGIPVVVGSLVVGGLFLSRMLFSRFHFGAVDVESAIVVLPVPAATPSQVEVVAPIAAEPDIEAIPSSLGQENWFEGRIEGFQSDIESSDNSGCDIVDDVVNDEGLLDDFNYEFELDEESN